MTPPHRARLTAIPLLLVAGLTACGTSNPATAPTPSGSGSPAPASATSASGSPSPTTRPARSVAPVPVESNPPGDIPDNLAFVRYANRAGRYSFTHPEGWARTVHGAQVRFTDKLNGVVVSSRAATRAPNVAQARRVDVPLLRASVPAFRLGRIDPVTVPAGRGVHLVFRRNSAPSAVTGKVYRDEVEEYLVYGHGRLVRMDLYGPVGADNVDAYRTMSQSLGIR